MNPLSDLQPPPPTVSALIAVHGAPGPLRDCLWALRENTITNLEVVVIDNASDEQTAAQLRDELAEFQDATLVSNTVNVGFGAAMNQAALLARAPYICLLNSDAFVEHGWDTKMVELLQKSPSVGAVVPQVLEDDGRLQEAGVLLSGDGRTWDVGNGKDPSKADYIFSRIVDYGSAVCMMLRRSDFSYIGGFDSIFGLGYYEDVDLCLRLGSVGLSTVYEPKSKVRHLRGASSKGELKTALIERNKDIFTTRWAEVLRDRPVLERNDTPGYLALHSRDALCDAKVLLLVDKTGAGYDTWIWFALARAFVGTGANVRISLVFPSADVALGTVGSLRDIGVEVLERDPKLFVAERRMHYDILIVDGEIDEDLLDSLQLHQPQAEVVVLVRANSKIGERTWSRAHKAIATSSIPESQLRPVVIPTYSWTEELLRAILQSNNDAGAQRLPTEDLAELGILEKASVSPVCRQK